MNFLIWIYVILILNKESYSGDITFEEESRKLKLTLPEELPDERVDLKNGIRLKETILDLLRQKLGFPVQKYSSQETDLEKQNFKTQSQKVQNLLSQSSSKEDEQIEHLKPTANLKLAEYDHLRYNKEKGFLDFDESDLDEDQIVAPPKGISNILRLSKENNDNISRKLQRKPKIRYEIRQSDRTTGWDRKSSGRKEKCKEGTYRYKDECNLCACVASEWNCTDVKCTKNYLIQDVVHTKHRMLSGGLKKKYDELRDQATGCVPGIIQTAGSNACPCRCVLPSVVVCEICPAVTKVDKPQKRNTTSTMAPDYHIYHYY